MATLSVAIDIGGVLINMKDNDWEEDAHESLEQLHALEGVKLYILSFCGKKREELIRQKLKNANITTWITEDRWYFVRKKSHKASILVEHGIDVLVDDSISNVQDAKRVGKHAIHFGHHTNTYWKGTVSHIKKIHAQRNK